MTEYDRIVRAQMALERMPGVDLELLDRFFEAGYDAGRMGGGRGASARLDPETPAYCVQSRENGLALGLMDGQRPVEPGPLRPSGASQLSLGFAAEAPVSAGFSRGGRKERGCAPVNMTADCRFPRRAIFGRIVGSESKGQLKWHTKRLWFP